MAAQQNSSYATLKEIQIRLKSVKNIAKITKSMKMIASTKLTRAQRAMETARFFGQTATGIYEGVPKNTEGKRLLITVSSDRGLCGAIHSSVSKYTKRILKESPSSQVVILGDKAKTQIARDSKGNIALSFNQVGRGIPTYREAAGIVASILQSGIEFDSVEILYNNFKSVLVYETASIYVPNENQIAEAESFEVYEQDEEDDEGEAGVLENLTEFNFTNVLFWTLAEAHASEMSSRRNAMENATKNAGEMITKLTMSYNRSRQANITNELCDIITGASAL